MKNILVLIGILTGLSCFTSAQNINGRFSSSLYAFERFDTADVSNTHLRAYQLLSLNINKDKFSLQSYMNFETDLSTEQKDDPRLRFYNLFLEGRDLFNVATIRLGRQPLFNSIGGGLFDGASLTLKHDIYRLSAYYGGNVPAYQKLDVIDKWEDNFVYGGKFSVRVMPELNFAAGYMNKNFKPREYYAIRIGEDLNPISTLIQQNSNQYRFLFGEVSYDMKKIFSADIRYDFDLNYETTSKFEFNGSYYRVRNWGFNVYYNYREPLVRYNSIFSVFDYGNTQEIEGGIDYKINKDYTLSGKLGHVVYKDDNSQRITLGLLTSYGSLTYRKNLGYSGELDAVSLYTAHTFLEGLLTPSAGISYTNYKLWEETESNSLMTLLAGFNIRPWRALSFDVQGQYMDNKIYQNDLRFFFKLNYWFNTNF